MRLLIIGSLWCLAVWAQAPAAPEIRSALQVSGSLRTRTEVWNWFEGAADNRYAYQGTLLRLSLGQSRPRFDWLVEMAAPVLLGLPDAAIAPGPQGQFGAGATYFASNRFSRNAAMAFPKQAYARFKSGAHAVRFGRIEFIDGAEVTPKDSTLAALKRDRVAHRLLGNFGFTHVMRSFDGVEYTRRGSQLNVTLFGARPTRGVFQVDGWGEVNSDVFYGAVTRQVQAGKSSGEWRLFFLQWDDWRSETLKTDNRTAAARAADRGDIRIGTLGGHYIHNFVLPRNQVDFLVWGVYQHGKWGQLDHRAGSIAVDIGWQPSRPTRLKPWLRAGVHYGSGDGDPNDGKHGTFVQPLPTARWYARFPFHTLMNIQDSYAGLILRPHARITMRSEVHSLRLAKAADLWYQGAGAFQPWTFGYSGRPANSQRSLATLYDVSLDYALHRRLSLGFYVAAARGKRVVSAIYPQGPNANLGFLELNTRF